MRLNVGAATDVGQLRTLNEDSYAVAADLVAVADGMGGHRAGEVASALALSTFQLAFSSRDEAAMVAAVDAANAAVFEHASSDLQLSGMGTTLCAAAVIGDGEIAAVNVGDSRIYLLRDGELRQISEDHSFVEALVREGRLTRAQAEVHPQKNVITRALGVEADVLVDAWTVPVQDGDRIVLCSDGLTNEVPEQTIEDALRQFNDPVEVCGRLITLANIGGGRDNITVVVADIAESTTSPEVLEPIGRPIERFEVAELPSGGVVETADQATVIAPTGLAPSAAPVSEPS
ncbi:MAG TPA: Stp1/IreP family PP2C-type Ser/Thr phosphatase, partial [Microthrixaceae bacterium]|nr:Stp1/IreP family PP2C-type Ser/Thr phosphatase [Microthrixaceae bacterium]